MNKFSWSQHLLTVASIVSLTVFGHGCSQSKNSYSSSDGSDDREQMQPADDSCGESEDDSCSDTSARQPAIDSSTEQGDSASSQERSAPEEDVAEPATVHVFESEEAESNTAASDKVESVEEAKLEAVPAVPEFNPVVESAPESP